MSAIGSSEFNNANSCVDVNSVDGKGLVLALPASYHSDTFQSAFNDEIYGALLTAMPQTEIPSSLSDGKIVTVESEIEFDSKFESKFELPLTVEYSISEIPSIQSMQSTMQTIQSPGTSALYSTLESSSQGLPSPTVLSDITSPKTNSATGTTTPTVLSEVATSTTPTTTTSSDLGAATSEEVVVQREKTPTSLHMTPPGTPIPGAVYETKPTKKRRSKPMWKPKGKASRLEVVSKEDIFRQQFGVRPEQCNYAEEDTPVWSKTRKPASADSNDSNDSDAADEYPEELSTVARFPRFKFLEREDRWSEIYSGETGDGSATSATYRNRGIVGEFHLGPIGRIEEEGEDSSELRTIIYGEEEGEEDVAVPSPQMTTSTAAVRPRGDRIPIDAPCSGIENRMDNLCLEMITPASPSLDRATLISNGTGTIGTINTTITRGKGGSILDSLPVPTPSASSASHASMGKNSLMMSVGKNGFAAAANSQRTTVSTAAESSGSVSTSSKSTVAVAASPASPQRPRLPSPNSIPIRGERVANSSNTKADGTTGTTTTTTNTSSSEASNNTIAAASAGRSGGGRSPRGTGKGAKGQGKSWYGASWNNYDYNASSPPRYGGAEWSNSSNRWLTESQTGAYNQNQSGW